MATNDRSLTRWMVAVGVVAALTALAGIDARATYGARVTADEPQYLLTAISLGEDRSLDIGDELAAERFRPFHEVDLNPQTIELDAQGRRVSPHDPLLPLLLALPVGVGGWVGAKIAMALLGAMVAALTLRLAVARLGAPTVPAALVVGSLAAAPPFSVYSVQVYPAMPAALCVLVGVLAVTAPGRPDGAAAGSAPRDVDRAGIDGASVAVVAAVIALPWLSVKYVPLTAVLAVAGLGRSWGGHRRVPVAMLAVYGAAGLSYLVLHQVFYDGWTAYAAGDHFVDGELLVVGADPDYIGRTRRLVGLVIDRGFGLAAWNPAFLAAPPALVWVVRRRQPVGNVLLAVIAAGWATATWIALTMHGWWWPGRQVVPVLPLAVAALAAMIGQLPRLRRLALSGLLAASVLGTASWLFLAWEASTDRRTLIIDFEQTANPWYQLWRLVLPNHRRMDPIDIMLTALWTATIGLVCLATFRRARGHHGTATEPAGVRDPRELVAD